MKKISILIPCFNEATSLPLLLEALNNTICEMAQFNWSFLFVNDGSTDSTEEVLKELRKTDSKVNWLSLSRNFGKEAAMLAGLDYLSCDAVVIMDADLQHPPRVIPRMIEKWEEGYDDVYAKRITRGKESYLRKKLSMFYYRLLSKSSRIDVLPNVGDFRLLDKQCIEALKQMREKGRYTKGMYCYIGFKKTFVEFETSERIAGNSSMTYKSLFNLAVEGIMSYTIVPLRIASFVGGGVSLLAFGYMIYVLLRAVLYGDPVAGYPTMMVVILFLSGVQLFSLGIIGEYLGRTYIEVKKRPVYYVRLYNGDRIV